MTKEKAVESPDLLSTFSTSLLAGTCSSGPSNGRYSIENLRGFFLDLGVFSRTRQPGGDEWGSSLVAVEGTVEPEVAGESRSSHRVKEVGQVRSEVGLLQVRPVLVLGRQPGLEFGPPGGHRHQVLVHHHLQLVHHLIQLGQVRRVERASVYICRPTTVRAIELIVHLGEP